MGTSAAKGLLDRDRAANRTGHRLLGRASLALIGMVGLLTVLTASVAVVADRTPPAPPSTLEIHAPRIVVIKSKRVLYLFDGDRLVRRYPVALGFAPIGQKRHADDGRTPEGVFRICTRTRASQYHRFLGISYPDPTAAGRGLRDGLISFGEYRSLVTADSAGGCPLWSTALGVGIGLHGCGDACLAVGVDWSAGCVALSDADIEELFGVLRIGDVVEILP
jgi:lipoprotein-anchoring transpeptidase ErfK/SrfK